MASVVQVFFTHRCVAGLQTGVAAGQLVLARQATHWCDPVSQYGAVGGHIALEVHAVTAASGPPPPSGELELSPQADRAIEDTQRSTRARVEAGMSVPLQVILLHEQQAPFRRCGAALRGPKSSLAYRSVRSASRMVHVHSGADARSARSSMARGLLPSPSKNREGPCP